MKKLLFTLTFLLLAGALKSQTVFWTETFSAGSAARGTLAHNYPADVSGNWSQTDIGTQGTSANQWYVSGEECGNGPGVCGSACSNLDASLHISAIGGLCGTPDCGAAYDESGVVNATHRRIESPNISTISLNNLTLYVNYIAAQATIPNDQVKVVYSCNGGTTWQDLPGASPLAPTQCCDCFSAALCAGFGLCCGLPKVCSGLDQGRWTGVSLALPVCAENIANFRFGFEWQNNGDGIGTDPSVAIDDITLSHAILLPLELTFFEVKAEGNEVQLDWAIKGEPLAGKFLIERSAGSDFEIIGEREVGGENVFTFGDKVQTSGAWYYRVVHLDVQGNRFPSAIRQIHTERTPTIDIFPNPILNSLLNIQITSDDAHQVNLRLCNALGQKLVEQVETLHGPGLRTFQIDMGDFPAGIYLLTVKSAAESSILKVAKNN